MTKDQILDAVKNLSRLDRDEILDAIIKRNNDNDYLISTEQKAELSTRISDVKISKIDLVDGNDVLDRMAIKHGV